MTVVVVGRSGGDVAVGAVVVAVVMMLCVVVGTTTMPTLATAERVKPTGAIEKLTTERFHPFLRMYPVAFVMFYSSLKCDECDELLPVFEEVAAVLKKKKIPIQMAKVDALDEAPLTSSYGFRELPVLTLFRNGKIDVPYGGDMTVEHIVFYLSDLAKPAAEELESLAEVQSFIEQPDYSVIAFAEEESTFLATFLRAANHNKNNFRFAYTSDPQALQEHGTNVLKVFLPHKLAHKKEQNVYTLYNDNVSPFHLMKFVSSSITDHIGVMNHFNSHFFFEKKPLVVVFFDLDMERDLSSVRYMRNRIFKLLDGSDFDGRVALANPTYFPNDVQDFGLSDDVNVVLYGREGTKYRMKEEFSLAALETFLKSFTDGALKEYVKSQPVPKSNPGYTTMVVGDTFEEQVFQEKDVLLIFHSEECAECAEHEGEWEELAEFYSDDDNVVIAKVDAVLNDYPTDVFDFTSLPALYFVPADSRKPKTFKGLQETDALAVYIRSNRVTTRSDFVKEEL